MFGPESPAVDRLHSFLRYEVLDKYLRIVYHGDFMAAMEGSLLYWALQEYSISMSPTLCCPCHKVNRLQG